MRRAIDGRVGFLVGWATLLDYFFLPMVIWLIGGAYLQAQFPGVPFWVWILAFIVVTTALNVRGIKTAERVNDLLMIFQVLVIGIFVAALAAARRSTPAAPGALADSTPFFNDATTLAGISAGAAHRRLLLPRLRRGHHPHRGDRRPEADHAPGDPAHRTDRRRRSSSLVAYATQLVHPGSDFDDAGSAAFEIARTIGGDLFSSVFLAGLVVAQFASGIAAQASTSRLLYAMGRDSVLPRRLFGYVHPRFRTPAFNILLTGVVGLIALRLDVATSTSFINFGAFTAFTFVNLSVIATYLRERRARPPAVCRTWSRP